MHTGVQGRAAAKRVRAVLTELAEEYPLRVSGRQAREMIAAVEHRAECSRRVYRELWARPERSFGAFESLPTELQTALGDAAGWEMQERGFTVDDRLHRRVYGHLFRLGSELSHRGKWIRSRGRRWRRLGHNVYLCGRVVCWICERLGRLWFDVTRFAPFTRTSGFHALWKWAGLDPMDLAIEYVGTIPCDPRISPVYRDRERDVVSCMMVGLDLLVTCDRVYYLEANINPGFMMRRLKYYRGDDPIFSAMAAYAREQGCARIVLFPSSITSVSRENERIWRDQVESEGMQLEIRDDPRVRSPYRRACDPIMDPEARRTLYLNVRTLHHPVNVLMQEKGRFEGEIERFNSRSPVEAHVPVPRRIHTTEDLLDPELHPRFPNLIVKHPRVDQAQGIALYKTDRLTEAMTRPPYVAFEYVPSDLQDHSADGVAGEYACKYRVNLIMTPDGPLFIDALKTIGGVPIPVQLPYGRVEDIRPYVLNSHLGSKYTTTTRKERDLLGPATLRIGRVVEEFLKRRHGTTWPEAPPSLQARVAAWPRLQSKYE